MSTHILPVSASGFYGNDEGVSDLQRNTDTVATDAVAVDVVDVDAVDSAEDLVAVAVVAGIDGA